MKTLIMSYSLTGNNDALAESVAKTTGADHIRITEPHKRSQAGIITDLLLNKTPKAETSAPFSPEKYSLVLFFGPVWIGQPATPFRQYLKMMKEGKYAFASISGGADGPNPKLAAELEKLAGKAPAAVIDLHIADLLPPDPKPTRKVTMAYKVTAEDIKRLTELAVKAISEITTTM